MDDRDSVPPVISKIEIFSNNDSGDQGIAKAGDEVTLRITSIEDIQKPNLEINSQSLIILKLDIILVRIKNY